MFGMSASWVALFDAAATCGGIDSVLVALIGRTLQPGEDVMILNGKEYTPVTVWLKDGQIRVSRSVIVALMAHRYGADVAEWLSREQHILP